MYLHLGGDVIVRTEDIVGIFDLENTTAGANTRKFLALAEKAGRVVNVTDELPRSFIVTQSDGQSRVYIAQISPATLKKRVGFIQNIANV
jgi:hypothetical protein